MLDLRNFAVVILAAGESSRMNVPKPLLRYNSKYRFVDKIINEYSDFGISNIIVVTNDSLYPRLNLDENINIVVNKNLEYERYYSIKLGLEKTNNCDYCYIQNIDNPFINEIILRKLYYKRNVDGSAIPVYDDKGGHPVLISKNIMNNIRNTNGDIMNFKDVLNGFSSNRVPIDDESILININTPDDYQKYFK